MVDVLFDVDGLCLGGGAAGPTLEGRVVPVDAMLYDVEACGRW